ncbi:hypothetical protein P9C02_01600 [Bacillus paralicheniformis]|uniref:hypothetical protein n=1 Tax=Bacillus paralicheniformis TaxID=1648923 RepID=UPI002DBFE3EE|nr:hypothetical protein [Bacillus paralicheniformis]MEC1189222.1 hypothetical protein [Bacillus paralicheniformis]MEC1279834.1 hypothetical protein [Bacillus paralicheniformis]MEC1297420.1 hypothetical protein [Bacillus paralicheniformis]
MKYIFIVDIDNHYRLFIFIVRFIQLFTEELNTGSGGRLIVKNLCVTIPDKKEQPYPEVSANGIAMALVRETDMIFLMMVLYDLHRAARFFRIISLH